MHVAFILFYFCLPCARPCTFLSTPSWIIQHFDRVLKHCRKLWVVTVPIAPYQRKYMLKEGIRGMLRETVSLQLWFEFSWVPKETSSTPHILCPTSRWFIPWAYIYTVADGFPRSPWKFKKQIGWHFRRPTLLFLSLTIYFLCTMHSIVAKIFFSQKMSGSIFLNIYDKLTWVHHFFMWAQKKLFFGYYFFHER